MYFSRRFKCLAAAALFLSVALPGVAGSLPEKNRAFYVNYDLTLAADGSIEKLVLRDKKLSALSAGFLEKSIRSWKFTPGSIEGVPQRTQSMLWLDVEAKPREDGNYELTIADARTGAGGATVLTPPTYPREELIRGREAVIRVMVSYDQNGEVTNVGRVAKLGAREERLMKPFEQASFAAAKKWRFSPEKIGDKGIAGTVIVPIKFCMVGSECRSFLTGTKEKEKLALQLGSQVLLGSSQVSIQRSSQLN